ncbi:MAG: methyltransferase, TIGR04325 family [Methylocella sp.]
MIKFLRNLRAEQIRQTYRVLSGFERLPGGRPLLRRMAHWPITAPILDLLLGYLRVFDSLREAEVAARSYTEESHQNPGYSKYLMSLSEAARPSDYAMLFHMRAMTFKNCKIFDLGGNIGNLFYLYDRYLNLPPDCTWLVYELPAWVEAGEKLATDRGENRLRFTRKWEDASGADLLIASGSLYYFDTPLAKMVDALPKKPPHILINRTPLIEGPTKATVQDGRAWMVACVLYNRAELITAFEAIGYEVFDTWKAQEHFIKIIGKPESSALACSGLFLRLRGDLIEKEEGLR